MSREPDNERERMNEHPVRCSVEGHGTRCIVAYEMGRGRTRCAPHGSHDRRYKDKRRRHAKRHGRK